MRRLSSFSSSFVVNGKRARSVERADARGIHASLAQPPPVERACGARVGHLLSQARVCKRVMSAREARSRRGSR